mmetsp:Transcript_32623/g.103301  ORF Transcript_32623/g.103301 Transcript_32623/m.103301 type:complete len:194 (-) Transcript_32623:626-1207(-)
MIVQSDLIETQDLWRDGSMDEEKVEDRSATSIDSTLIWGAEGLEEFVRSQEQWTLKRLKARLAVQEEFTHLVESVRGMKSLTSDSRIAISPATAMRTTSLVENATENRVTRTMRKLARGDEEVEEKIPTAINSSRICWKLPDYNPVRSSRLPLVMVCESWRVCYVPGDDFYRIFAKINLRDFISCISVTYKGD